MKQEKLLEIKNLSVGFTSENGVKPILNNINLQIDKNEIVALVGESGCGKSVTAKSIIRLLKTPPTVYMNGSIMFNDKDLLEIDEKALRKIRGNQISMIFQEPLTSLNPVLTIGNQVGEAISLHQKLSRREIKEKTIEMLEKVKIPSPEKRLNSYPGQFSGGMRQRIMIAMAIACQPQLLIADEPTTALDVTIQAQILKLMKQVQEDSKMSIMLITHDLGVVAEFAQRVVVMYAGQIVETALTKELFKNPQHPYTKGLLKSLPKLNDSNNRLDTIEGSVPTVKNMPKGCRFHPRCPYAMEECVNVEPEIYQLDDKHTCKCHLLKATNL